MIVFMYKSGVKFHHMIINDLFLSIKATELCLNKSDT